jgi:hypothetical protein
MEFVKKIEFIDPEIDIEITDKGEIIASVATVDKEVKLVIFIEDKCKSNFFYILFFVSISKFSIFNLQ